MLRVTLTCLCALLCAARSSAVFAQDAVLNVDSLRGAFADAGYEVDPAVAWPWQMPTVTTFQVTDRRGDRLLLVEVFADASQARVEAERKAGGARINNVVLFQSRARALTNDAEVECAPELATEEPSTAPPAVDRDLVALAAGVNIP